MEDKLNFSEISALIVDGDRFSSAIVSQILRGFGLTRQFVVGTGEDALRQLVTNTYDLLITECVLPDTKGADLIKWIRRHPKDDIRYITVVVLTGYSHFSNVIAARDGGVNSVVCKPIAPTVLFDHIAWSAKSDRPFIEADEYSGPCRRFRFGEAAPGLNRRVSDHYSEPAGPKRTKNTEGAT